jgi:hypothetical protein
MVCSLFKLKKLSNKEVLKVSENLLNDQLISDYDLVSSISEDLAVFYRKAISQSVTECYPESLVNYRSSLSVIVSLAFKEPVLIRDEKLNPFFRK